MDNEKREAVNMIVYTPESLQTPITRRDQKVRVLEDHGETVLVQYYEHGELVTQVLCAGQFKLVK